MGDAEVAALCFAAIDEECPAHVEGGALHRPQASVWAHAVEFLARSGGPHAFRRLVEQPRAAGATPVLHEIPYPHVLVARAVHSEQTLRAVLYPGRVRGAIAWASAGSCPAPPISATAQRSAGSLRTCADTGRSTSSSTGAPRFASGRLGEGDMGCCLLISAAIALLLALKARFFGRHDNTEAVSWLPADDDEFSE
jgi:hypothetical protein